VYGWRVTADKDGETWCRGLFRGCGAIGAAGTLCRTPGREAEGCSGSAALALCREAGLLLSPFTVSRKEVSS
jgi:hypothetical protein